MFGEDPCTTRFRPTALASPAPGVSPETRRTTGLTLTGSDHVSPPSEERTNWMALCTSLVESRVSSSE